MFRIIKGVIFFIAAMFLFGFISMSLWNCLIPDLFHGPHLDYWQTLGLLLLAKIFFGGFHGHHRKGCCHGRNRHWSKEWGKDIETYKGWSCWGKDWEEKFKNMTPEERDDWKHNLKNQFKSAKEKMENDVERDEKSAL